MTKKPNFAEIKGLFSFFEFFIRMTMQNAGYKIHQNNKKGVQKAKIFIFKIIKNIVKILPMFDVLQ